jgi:hypothetical protein
MAVLEVYGSFCDFTALSMFHNCAIQLVAFIKAITFRHNQGHRLFQGRVGPTRFERRPTIRKDREIMVALQSSQTQQGDGPAAQ